jgi:hypothetical protein
MLANGPASRVSGSTRVKTHIPPNYVVKPASFSIPLIFQAIPPMVYHELSRPRNLGVTHAKHRPPDP